MFPKNYNLSFVNSVIEQKHTTSLSNTPFSDKINKHFGNKKATSSEDEDEDDEDEDSDVNGNSSGKHIANGSSSYISNNGKLNYWQGIEKSLKVILSNDEGSSFSINKNAGVITVFSKYKQHQLVAQYINKIKSNLNSQVLIEAKIIEVDLDDEYKNGIDWDNFYHMASRKFSIGLSGGVLPLNNDTSFFKLENGTRLDSTVSFLDKFGTTKALANPRLMVTSNQSAIMKVAENDVFFKLTIDKDRVEDTNGNIAVNTVTNSHLITIPIGLIMYVQPTIDTENNSIMLSVRPTFSKINGYVSDPAIEIAKNDISDSDIRDKISSSVPKIQIREITSSTYMKSGETIILGGFLESTSDNTSHNSPIFSVPMAKNDKHKVKELVVFLKATILKNDLKNFNTELDYLEKELLFK